MRYCMGDQWGDTIKVWDHGSYVYMTEREYMERKNTTPMSNNVMASILESIGGLYAKQGTRMLCQGQRLKSYQRHDERDPAMQLAVNVYARPVESRHQGLCDRRPNVRKRGVGVEAARTS